MNREIVEVFFPDEVKAIDAGRCPFCSKHGPFSFRDELSRKEFEISGLCQECQDTTFTEGEEE